MNNFFKVLSFSFIITVQFVFAQTSSQSLWQDVDEAQITAIGQRYIIPQLYRTIQLDVAGMKNFLSEAPLEFSHAAISKLVVLYLPMPDGLLQRFSIVESPIMEPELAAKYPEIKTYLEKELMIPMHL
jgi:hypothetical protein